MLYDLEKIKNCFERHYLNYEILILNYVYENPQVVEKLKSFDANEYSSDEVYFGFRRELNSNLMFEFIKHRDKVLEYDLNLFEIENYYSFLMSYEAIYFNKARILQEELIN